MVSYAGDNIRVTSEFVKWRGRANVINVGLSLLCVYDEKGKQRDTKVVMLHYSK